MDKYGKVNMDAGLDARIHRRAESAQNILETAFHNWMGAGRRGHLSNPYLAIYANGLGGTNSTFTLKPSTSLE